MIKDIKKTGYYLTVLFLLFFLLAGNAGIVIALILAIKLLPLFIAIPIAIISLVFFSLEMFILPEVLTKEQLKYPDYLEGK